MPIRNRDKAEILDPVLSLETKSKTWINLICIFLDFVSKKRAGSLSREPKIDRFLWMFLDGIWWYDDFVFGSFLNNLESSS